jgi:N utilization substance protein B
VLQVLYAYFTSEERSLSNSEKELFFGIQKTYDLYHYIMMLVVEMADYAEGRIEIKRNKHQPTEDDLNPNTKFISNLFVAQLRENRQLKGYTEQRKLNWVNSPELIKELYLILIESDIYAQYMGSNIQSYLEDRKFVEKIFNNILLVSEELSDELEEQSIYWNDDIEFVISVIGKTMKKFNEQSDTSVSLMPMFKDEDDREFAKELFRKSILNHDELQQLIKVHSNNWDVERIAFMDILIMQLAIAEFLYFPSIPTKVTMNEYIELSKYYSTEKSRNFINGILDKTLKDLKKEGKIKKTGRGLVGE